MEISKENQEMEKEGKEEAQLGSSWREVRRGEKK
jgi:hypothetical protein